MNKVRWRGFHGGSYGGGNPVYVFLRQLTDKRVWEKLDVVSTERPVPSSAGIQGFSRVCGSGLSIDPEEFRASGF